MTVDSEHRVSVRDTYKTTAAERADREAMRRLHQRLRLPNRWLRLDECGCWCIAGPAGRIYAYSDQKRWLGGYLVVSQPDNPHELAASIKSLGGVVRQRGDGEGVVLVMAESLPPMPAIRRAIGSGGRGRSPMPKDVSDGSQQPNKIRGPETSPRAQTAKSGQGATLVATPTCQPKLLPTSADLTEAPG
jgi:hypothetical protein